MMCCSFAYPTHHEINRYECTSANYKLILIHWPELGVGSDAIPFIDYEINGKSSQSFRYFLQEDLLKLLPKELAIGVKIEMLNPKTGDDKNIDEREFTIKAAYEYTDKKTKQAHFVGTIKQLSKWSNHTQRVECTKHSTL